MFKLYTDRSEIFEAKLDITGASVNDSICRLVVEGSSYNLMFNGNIDSNGNCEIPIDKLKKVYSEGDTGDIRLEVIADDTYFVPWRNKFVVERSKNITAEIKSSKRKAKIVESKPKVKLVTREGDLKILKMIVAEMQSTGITIDNFLLIHQSHKI